MGYRINDEFEAAKRSTMARGVHISPRPKGSFQPKLSVGADLELSLKWRK